jgi:RNase H-like domain found in reverse transcriptase
MTENRYRNCLESGISSGSSALCMLNQLNYYMRQLLEKDAKFQWSSQCQPEFDFMIQKLTSAPVLQALDINKDLFLYTDSSYAGTGFENFQFESAI